MPDPLQVLGLPPDFRRVRNNLSKRAKGSELVATCYDWYRANFNTSAASQRAINGKVLEGLVMLALHEAGIHPIYYQAEVTNIPHVVYDILLYHAKRPIALSCKVSLRERWKQADHEAAALQQVYRGARSFLLTLNKNEGRRLQSQIEDFDVRGLDECVVIQHTGDRLDALLRELQGLQFVEATHILPVQGAILRA